MPARNALRLDLEPDRRNAARRRAQPKPGTGTARAALDFIVAHQGAAIFQLKDFHEPLRESPEIRRRLRDVYESCLDQRKFVVITSAGPLHPGGDRAEYHVSRTPSSRPGRVAEFLREEIARMRGAMSQRMLWINLRAPCRDSLSMKRGMRCGARWRPLGVWDPNPCPAVLEEKRLLVNRSGVIEYIADGTSLDEVGGLEGLKKWLLERRKLFHLRDSLATEIVPKGVLIMGIPGLRQEPVGARRSRPIFSFRSIAWT